MASAYGKFLAQVTVPTGGWDLAFSTSTAESATVTAGTYGSVLSVGKELQDQLRALGGDHTSDTVVISTTQGSTLGKTTLTIAGVLSMTWASCDDGLTTLFGFDETESLSSSTVTSTNAHTHGWYPGHVSYNTGEGIQYDSGWVADEVGVESIAGNGEMQSVGPDRLPYTRTLRFGALHRDEVVDERDRGCACFFDRWRRVPIRWYMDREDGSVGSYGTQGDPGAYHNDDDCDFYIIKVKGQPRRTVLTHPDWFSFELTMHGQPA